MILRTQNHSPRYFKQLDTTPCKVKKIYIVEDTAWDRSLKKFKIGFLRNTQTVEKEYTRSFGSSTRKVGVRRIPSQWINKAEKLYFCLLDDWRDGDRELFYGIDRRIHLTVLKVVAGFFTGKGASRRAQWIKKVGRWRIKPSNVDKQAWSWIGGRLGRCFGSKKPKTLRQVRMLIRHKNKALEEGVEIVSGRNRKDFDVHKESDSESVPERVPERVPLQKQQDLSQHNKDTFIWHRVLSIFF